MSNTLPRILSCFPNPCSKLTSFRLPAAETVNKITWKGKDAAVKADGFSSNTRLLSKHKISELFQKVLEHFRKMFSNKRRRDVLQETCLPNQNYSNARENNVRNFEFLRFFFRFQFANLIDFKVLNSSRTENGYY